MIFCLGTGDARISLRQKPLKKSQMSRGENKKSNSFILLSMGLFGGVAHSCLKVSPRIKVDVCLLRNLSASDSQLEIEHWRSRNYSMWPPRCRWVPVEELCLRRSRFCCLPKGYPLQVPGKCKPPCSVFLHKASHTPDFSHKSIHLSLRSRSLRYFCFGRQTILAVACTYQ